MGETVRVVIELVVSSTADNELPTNEDIEDEIVAAMVADEEDDFYILSARILERDGNI